MQTGWKYLSGSWYQLKIVLVEWLQAGKQLETIVTSLVRQEPFKQAGNNLVVSGITC